MKSYSRDIILLLTFFAVVLLAAAWWSGRLDGVFKGIDRLIG